MVITAHFANWPDRLTKTVDYPKVCIFDFLESSARFYPDKPAVIYYGRRISYSELRSSVEKLAAFLAAQGIKKGDRVAIYAPNTPHFIISFYGIMRANAVTVPVNPMLIKDELSYILNDSGARIIITTGDLYPRVREILGQTKVEVVIVGNYADYLPENPEIPVSPLMNTERLKYQDTVDWQRVLSEEGDPPTVEVNYRDMCLIPYTSATTGRPKGCIHTHDTLVAITMVAYWVRFTNNSIHLATLPFFHVTGMIQSMVIPISFGTTTVLLTRWDRETALQAIEKYRITTWINISTMVVDLLASPNLKKYDISSLLMVGGGGAPLPEAVGKKLYEMTGIKYIEGYGLTETISTTHSNPEHKPKMQCLGIPVFDVKCKIINPDTLEELEIGQEGELVINCPQLFKGYWNNPKETEKAFISIEGTKYFRTGDIVKCDEEGYFFIVDRAKRMINASGFKVWPTEVEGFLYKHPAVLEACVVGVPDPVRGENVKAYIVLKDGYKDKVTAEDIIKWSKENMAAYKYPRIVEFVKDLPKTASGKILWRVLQDMEKYGRKRGEK